MDLALHDGDLFIDNEGNFLTKDGESAIHASVYRAVVTPITYIGRWVLDGGELIYIDGDYGDAIYLDLSEPFDSAWLPMAKGHLQTAMSFVSPVATLNDLSANYKSSDGMGIDGVDFNLDYSIGDINGQVLLGDIPL
jgi:hypothetical protein